MTKVSPAKFVEQVKQETSKVTWPTRKETLMSTGMVLFMVILAALFFLFADWVIATSVRALLGI